MTAVGAEVQRRLSEARSRIREAAEAAVAECAEAAVEQARADCPVASGRLRDSIGTEVVADAGASVIEARIRADAPYAAAVELGLGESPPQPFLWPALERLGPVLVRVLRARVGIR